MSRIWDYIISRLKEKGTIAVVVTTILTIVGVSLSPGQTDAIIAAGAAFMAILVAFLPEKTVETPSE